MELKVAQLCPTLCDTMDYTVHGILQTRILKPFPSPGDHPNPGIEPRSPALQADSLPAEPSGKPQNTQVCSLSLLQCIFETQRFKLGSPALQADSIPTELFQILKDDAVKVLHSICHQFGKVSSGQRNGKGQFSKHKERQCQKNVQTTARLHSSHTLAK